MKYFTSDPMFGGKPSFGSTTNTGVGSLVTPTMTITNLIFSIYYNNGFTSTFSNYDTIFISLLREIYITGNTGGNAFYIGTGAYDNSPSINGKATSSTILPLPTSTMTFTGASTSKPLNLGDEVLTGFNRRWLGAFRNIIIASTALTNYQKQLIEGVIAWDGGHQSNLVASHRFRNRPPLIGD
jgi:hypothetical protein